MLDAFSDRQGEILRALNSVDATQERYWALVKSQCLTLNRFTFAAFNLPNAAHKSREAGQAEPIDAALFRYLWGLALEHAGVAESEAEQDAALRTFGRHMGRDEFLAAHHDFFTAEVTMFDLRYFFLEHVLKQRLIASGTLMGAPS